MFIRILKIFGMKNSYPTRIIVDKTSIQMLNTEINIDNKIFTYLIIITAKSNFAFEKSFWLSKSIIDFGNS